MKKITFEDIYTIGDIVFENKLYKHIHYPEMLNRYDSNFIEFKHLPTLAEFKEAEDYLSEFHFARNQKHVKFYFPENEKPDEKEMNYFKKQGYEVGYLELYAIQPDQFPKIENSSDILVQSVTDDNFEAYLKLRFEQDLEFGKDFATQKIGLNKRQFNNPAIMQIIASYKGKPAGAVDVIMTEKMAEIDSLDVNEFLRKKGIGSRLQYFVMRKFWDKTVILVADGEDTPREMYQKQNYHYGGFKYEAQKIYKEQTL
ncbi:GNAT family N-acetyltransferase [Oceanobacillus sp. CF4.6]|uniref:GNAT family N-acetyltransferase n=1 Tax=Oceanobacillus sp. CF4.6 TaxID=3373080 RepID=UPI003EE5E08D